MWRCFIIEPADPRTEYLTIHNLGALDYHRCVVAVLDGVDLDDSPDQPPGGYPSTCPTCGSGFTEHDHSKMGTTSWRNVEAGEVKPKLSDHGIGAMFDKTEWSVHQGEDGKSWGVVCPPGDEWDVWGIDERASSGGYWKREGVAPLLVVTPSIAMPHYHGFLGSNGAPPGYLSDDLEGRTYANKRVVGPPPRR